MGKQNVINSLTSLVGGNFSGILNFKLDEFWHHVQASAKRTIKKNTNSAVRASRLRVGEIALTKIVDMFMEKAQASMPDIKIPILGRFKVVDLEKYRELISIILGNASLLGFDIISYFGIPLTGLGEVTANCMVEYAYDLGSKKVMSWIKPAKMFDDLKGVFSQTEDEFGSGNLKNVMTDYEKAKYYADSNKKNADLIEKEKRSED